MKIIKVHLQDVQQLRLKVFWSRGRLQGPNGVVLIVQARGLVASGSCARVCLDVGSCKGGKQCVGMSSWNRAVAFTNAEYVLDCAWILVV